MMKNKSLKIKVDIADYPYRINIDSELEEEIVRAAAKNINQKIEKLKTQFQADLLQYVSMAALQEGIEKIKAAKDLDHRVDLISVDNINNNLEQCLRSYKGLDKGEPDCDEATMKRVTSRQNKNR